MLICCFVGWVFRKLVDLLVDFLFVGWLGRRYVCWFVFVRFVVFIVYSSVGLIACLLVRSLVLWFFGSSVPKVTILWAGGKANEEFIHAAVRGVSFL